MGNREANVQLCALIVTKYHSQSKIVSISAKLADPVTVLLLAVSIIAFVASGKAVRTNGERCQLKANSFSPQIFFFLSF